MKDTCLCGEALQPVAARRMRCPECKAMFTRVGDELVHDGFMDVPQLDRVAAELARPPDDETALVCTCGVNLAARSSHELRCPGCNATYTRVGIDFVRDSDSVSLVERRAVDEPAPTVGGWSCTACRGDLRCDDVMLGLYTCVACGEQFRRRGGELIRRAEYEGEAVLPRAIVVERDE